MSKQHPVAPTDWKQRSAASIRSWSQGAWTHFVNVFVRHWVHWIFALLLIGFGPTVGRLLERNEAIYNLRYAVYRFVQHPWPFTSVWQDVYVVLIDDDSYYHGEPAGRAPIDRRYLSKLVDKLAQFKPAVIALDFNFQASDPTGNTTVLIADGDTQISLAEDPKYAAEMLELLQKVREVAPDCPIVLPQMIDHDGEEYTANASAYDGFEFPAEVDVKSGYIQFADDIRTLPPELPIKDGPPIPSFSITAVSLFNIDCLKGTDLSEERFCSFILRDPDHELTAKQILQSTDREARDLKRKLRSKIIIVGAGWHRNGYMAGSLIDSYPTPVGELAGVLIHANYVQALLDRRSFRLLGSGVFEWLFGFLLAYALVLRMTLPRKIIAVTLIVVIPLVLSYLILQQLGIYCDTVVVDLLLLGHIGVERMFSR